MHKLSYLIFLLSLAAGAQVKGQPAARQPEAELRQGQAALRPHYDKDEAAFKAIANPSPAQIKAEHNLSACFARARSTYHLYNQSETDYVKPNCDTYFKALEDDLAK